MFIAIIREPASFKTAPASFKTFSLRFIKREIVVSTLS